MEIELRDGIARVDDEDAALVSAFHWRSMQPGPNRIYAYTTIAGRRVYMHHLILNRAPRGRGRNVIDHKNGDGLDNRRANLRPANKQQNGANRDGLGGTSAFKGVCRDTKTGLWLAQIMVNYSHNFLGYYDAEEDAARAYDLAALAAWGAYARLNFPDRTAEPPPVRSSIKARRRAVPAPAAEGGPAKRGAGDRNSNAKLTEAQAREIVAALREVPRRTQTEIAGQFGVSQPHISRIAKRQTWPHLWDDAG